MRAMRRMAPRSGRPRPTLGISFSLATGVVAVVGAAALASLLEVRGVRPGEAGDAVPNPRTIPDGVRMPGLT